jgi:hypothetical protein
MDHDRLTVIRNGKKICLLSLLDLVATQWHTCGWGDGNRDFRPGAHDSHNGQSNFAHEAREFLRERFQFRYKEGPSDRFVVPDEHSDRGQASRVGGADSCRANALASLAVKLWPARRCLDADSVLGRGADVTPTHYSFYRCAVDTSALVRGD